MALQDADCQLGKSFAKHLEKRCPVQLHIALGILKDLMGADVSLFPSLRLLASQPIFLQFINATPGTRLAPQRDQLLTAAQENLAPPIVERIRNFLDGYMEVCHSQEEAKVDKENTKPSFPSVLNLNSEDLPSTVLDHPDTRTKEPAKVNHISDAQRRRKQHTNVGLVLFLLALCAAIIGLIKIPNLCQTFGICSSEEPEKTNSIEKNNDSMNNSDQKPSDPSKQQSNQPKVREPNPDKPAGPSYQQPYQPAPYTPPAYTPLPKELPDLPEPLW